MKNEKPPNSSPGFARPSAWAQWFEETIIRFVVEAPENKLPDFKGIAIFARPIIAVADGDDAIFGLFSKAVSPRHPRPRQVLRRYSPSGTNGGPVRVVSWALPFGPEVRHSNRSGDWPSELYSVARNNGGAFINELSRHLCQSIENQGFTAISPALTDDYDAFRSADFGFSSTWSERHVAYAAGLGRFGLNGCLMTPLGTSVRLGSIVTSLPLPVTAAKRECYEAPCLESGGGVCGACIERCPVRAISEAGLDKDKCHARRKTIRESSLEPLQKKYDLLPAPIVKNGKKEMGYSLGCALCLMGVPCEAAPYPVEKKAG